MKVKIFWLIPVLTLSCMMGFSPLSVLAQAAEGKEIYISKCAICHGADGKGHGPAAAALSPPPQDFNTGAFWQRTGDVEITKTIDNGKGQMPASNLSPSQIKAVIDYMKQAFKPRG